MAMTFHPNGVIEGFSGTSMPTGSVIQVQSVTDTSSSATVQQSTSGAWEDLGSLSVNITLSETSSKVLVLASNSTGILVMSMGNRSHRFIQSAINSRLTRDSSKREGLATPPFYLSST